jgi:hypothetical protein
MTSNRLHLSRSELEALRNLQAGFYERPLDDPVWEKLANLGLVALREPPSPGRTANPRGRPLRAALTGSGQALALLFEPC